MTTCAANIPFAHSVRTFLLVSLRASVPRFACFPLGAVVAQIYRPYLTYYHSLLQTSRRRASNRSDDQHCTLSRVKRPTARATIQRTQPAPNSRLRRAPPSRASTIGRKCHLYATCTSVIVLVPLPAGFLHVNTQKKRGTEARAVTPRPAGPGRPGGRLAGGSGGKTAIGWERQHGSSVRNMRGGGTSQL